MVGALDGLTEALGESDLDALDEADAEAEEDGLTEALGETDALTDDDGDTEAEPPAAVREISNDPVPLSRKLMS